jgi:2'-5' RNA ligase
MLAHRNWRTDWTAERTCLYWYLTFEDQPGLRSLFEEVEDDLRQVASIDVVPPSWLHLTLLEVGFADEVTQSEMDDLVTAARSVTALLPLALELGPISTMTDAVVLPVASEPLVVLQGLLAEGLRTSRAVEPDPEGFWPHVSLAYTNIDCLRDDVMGALGNVAERTTALTVPRLTLAAVTRERDHYRWQEVTALTLEEESALGVAT